MYTGASGSCRYAAGADRSIGTSGSGCHADHSRRRLAALYSTSRFDEQVAYLRDVFGMRIERQGPAVVDHHFQRLNVTIVCFTVDDLDTALGELEARKQAPISPVITDGSGWGWTYLRMPDGAIYQLQGRVAEQGARAIRP